MKVNNSEIELVVDSDDSWSGDWESVHTLRYVKTPRGQKKDLLTVFENRRGRRLVLLSISILPNGGAMRDSRKLLSALIRGSFRPATQFHPKTVEVLESNILNQVASLSLEFRE